MTRITQMFVLLFLLNLLDAATTAYLISMGGIDVEVNPFMKWVIIEYGNVGMVASKSLFIVTFYVVCRAVQSSEQVRALTFARFGLIFLCGVYSALCTHNLYAMVAVMRVASGV